MSVIALIPARKNSKGFPQKNKYLLGGKKLIQWTIDEALQVTDITTIIVSTDDEEILALASFYPTVQFVQRPHSLCEDTTPMSDVILHHLQERTEQSILLLQPTSPLRKAMDIKKAIELHQALQVPVVSVTKNVHPPYWTYTMKDTKLHPLFSSSYFVQRQQLPETYQLNGAIYITHISNFKMNRTFLVSETFGYEMPIERSVDIDSEIDFLWAQFLLQHE